MTQECADMAKTLRRAAELAAAGLVPAGSVPALDQVAARYAVAVTPAVAAAIDTSDPNDPVARQYLPSPAELATAPEERADPIGDDVHAKAPGIVHRYADRVLLKPTHACAVYCRFCFRREVVGQGPGLNPGELAQALDYIRADPAIWEAILTGGDPLVLAPRRLREIVGALDAVAHLQVIRLHTRVPIADPARVTPALVRALRAEKAVFVVVHANHARELTPDARAACRRILDAGIPVLAQSVLLKGVNDTPDALEALLRALVAARIKPYYLHHADLAPGTAQFRTTLAEGQRLMRSLRGRVSGLCQPSYVLDVPGGHGKVPVGPRYLFGDETAGWTIEDPQGRTHGYPPRES
ncbi:MAG: lysine-2,3-aminomutase-like protein [Alphaproteobacteria bacterium]|nr:lysine-2,3-aminomutase-like protein [Alphaproteobacteria bacterium]